MEQYVSDIAFTPAVKAVQSRVGSRKAYARMEQGRGWADRITPDVAEFIGERDSMYLGTANADGQPYIQHRGGPKGFLRVLDENTLAFADFSGNRQYISVGNLDENDKAYIFLMDYPNRQRVKIWGTAEVVDDDPELLKHLTDPSYEARPERAIRFHVKAWDSNCPQHIMPRFSQEQVEGVTGPLRDRIVALEEENRELRRKLDLE